MQNKEFLLISILISPNKSPKTANKSAFSIKTEISLIRPNNLEISALTVLKCNYIKNKK
nr:MAG TPA: hypothetical protein [Caudoviricetes sp.]